MPSTRSSARLAGQGDSAAQASSNSSGNKRKAAPSTAQPKKGAKAAGAKKQKTIEQTLPDLEVEKADGGDDGDVVEDEGVKDEDMKDAADVVEEKQDETSNGETGANKTEDDASKVEEIRATDERKETETSAAAPTEAQTAQNGVNDISKDEEPTAELTEVGEGEPAEADKKEEDTSAPANGTTETPSDANSKATETNQANGDSEKSAEASASTIIKETASDSDTKAQDTAQTNGDAEKSAEAAAPTSNDKQQSTKESTTTTEKPNEPDVADSNKKPSAETPAEPQPDTSGAVEVMKEREQAQPSSILEKGIIYFFTRGRVGIDDPQSVQDIARSYIVLRPLPPGAKLSDGTLEDSKNNRLLALPKKVLPKSARDQFLTFVEKTNTTIAELKENFMQGSEYTTKTTGVRHTPAVAPIGEGVYAITTTGERNTHLAYMITVPDEMGDVQNDMGLRKQGSFALSVKNPEAPSPANAGLQNGAKYPKEIQDEFRGLRWAGLHPKHLGYEATQILLIGEAQGEEAFAHALDGDGKGKGENGDKETALEEVQKLEEEDHQRVEHLKGEEADSIYADLKLSHEEYPKLMTTW